MASCPPSVDLCGADDPDFRANGNVYRDCKWISENPEKRCILDNNALDKSLFVCNPPCNDSVCYDDPTWFANGKDNRDCEWIATKPHTRCLLDKDALYKCPSVCRDFDWVADNTEKRCSKKNNEPFLECSGVCNPFFCSTTTTD
jgi:hypothetical protein